MIYDGRGKTIRELSLRPEWARRHEYMAWLRALRCWMHRMPTWRNADFQEEVEGKVVKAFVDQVEDYVQRRIFYTECMECRERGETTYECSCGGRGFWTQNEYEAWRAERKRISDLAIEEEARAWRFESATGCWPGSMGWSDGPDENAEGGV